MADGKRRAAVAGGVLGAVAAGVAAGLAMERAAIARRRERPDPEAREPFGRLPGTRRTVLTEDGVPLHVEESGYGPLTIVFVHGFALSLAEWHYQRRDLADLAKLVAYDHRGHGQSGRGEQDMETIEQLGRDLAAVIDKVAPEGPVMLVGHSMGGMSIMSLARQRPELFGERVAGAVLISTSAGHVVEVLTNLPVRATGLLSARVLAPFHKVVSRNTALVERSRRVGTDLAYAITRTLVFGEHASPAHVEFTERMAAAVPADVLTSFARAFFHHDEYEGLGALSRIPVVVMVGSDDRLTPVGHSRGIVKRVPSAELIEFAGAGHMLNLERAPLVNLHLRAFAHRVQRGVRAGRPEVAG